jgi:hypothetical protein
MADSKISALDAASDLTGADIPIVQSGANKKAGIALFTPAAIGAATAAQGTKADSALQPSEITSVSSSSGVLTTTLDGATSVITLSENITTWNILLPDGADYTASVFNAFVIFNPPVSGGVYAVDMSGKGTVGLSSIALGPGYSPIIAEIQSFPNGRVIVNAKDVSGDSSDYLDGATTKYYVAASGSNANSGTTPEAPWLHHPHDGSATGVSAATVLSPGDVVCFKRGDTFDGVSITVDEAGTALAPIITGAYGSGSRPRLVNTSSYVVFCSGETDSYNHFYDLDLVGNFGTGVAIFTGGAIGNALKRCSIKNTHSTGFGVNISAENGVVSNCDVLVTGKGRCINSVGVANVVISQNNIQTLSVASASETAFCGIYLDGSSNVYCGGNTIGSNRSAASFFYGVRLTGCSGVLFDGNTVINGNIGSAISFVATASSGCTFSNNTIIGGVSAINIANGAGGNNVISNLVYGHLVNGINYVVEADSEEYSLCAHNTVIHAPNETGNVRGHGIEIEDGKVELKNNLVVIPESWVPNSAPTSVGVHCVAYTTGYTDIKASNNCYYVYPSAAVEGGVIGKHTTGDITTLADLQTALVSDAACSEKEVNSIEADPALTDEYRLDSTSFARNAGVATNVKLDIVGRYRDTVPSVGAFEF